MLYKFLIIKYEKNTIWSAKGDPPSKKENQQKKENCQKMKSNRIGKNLKSQKIQHLWKLVDQDL